MSHPPTTSVHSSTTQLGFRHRKPLSPKYDFIHHLHCLHGIVTFGCLATQHDTISSIIDGIRHISNLCSGRTRVLRHTLQHLRGHNNRLPHSITCCNNLFLCISHLLNWNLHTQITSRHHNTVTLHQYLVKITQRRHTLNLTDYQRGRGARIHTHIIRHHMPHKVTDLTYALGALHETGCNVVNILRQPVLDIILILIGNGR
mmetsp:Transcript_15782/g.19674  ORF Transcript_15782/g.19674 Transcript_15782/m.19674 type:complete len:202 (-) Transcript_15782:783-1388(-)